MNSCKNRHIFFKKFFCHMTASQLSAPLRIIFTLFFAGGCHLLISGCVINMRYLRNNL